MEFEQMIIQNTHKPATKKAGGCHINPEYSGLKTDFFKGLNLIYYYINGLKRDDMV